MTIHVAIPDYATARQAMVDGQLRPQGVNDPAVIAAMSAVPRELFVPDEVKPLAYSDRSLPLGEGRHMPSAEAVGLLLTALAPEPGEKALVVGAGTGYSAALLAEIGAEVIALESDTALAAVARERGLSVVEGPLEEGCKKNAPYDLILVDGAVGHVPDAIVAQLAEGGRLGAPLVDERITRLTVGRKAAGGLGLHSIADVGVAPLPGFIRPRSFTF